MLEDRTVPTTMSVVPANGANGVSTFATLAQALALANPGDTILIDPGSTPTPGTSVVNVTKDGITVRSPAIGPVGLQASGTELGHLVLAGNHDTLAELFVDQVDISPGKTGETLVNSIFNNGGINQLTGDGSETDGGNVVSGNTFLGPAAITLGYKNATGSSDQVTNNVFVNHLNTNAISAFNETGGLVISNNRIIGNDPTTAISAIFVQDSVGTISGNVIHLGNNGNNVGIQVQDGDDINADVSTDNRTTNVTVSGNVITSKGAGTGIYTVRNSDINKFSVSVANNALPGNLVGLYVQGNTDTGDADFGAVTAGGQASGSINTANGPEGFSANSAGGNDFRGYTGTNGSFAVLANDNAFGSSSKVLAQSNIFSVADPTVVTDVSNAPAAVIDVSNAQTGGAANLIAMFDTVALSAPDQATLTNLSGASAADQAKAAVGSTTAVKAFVDGLYTGLLGRAPAGGEDQFWITVLQGGFLTEEQVIAGFASAPEYYNKVTQGSPNPNGTWIQSLYSNLLGRQASAPEVNYWLSVLPALGQTNVVSGFVNSAEFRADQVRSFYGVVPVGVVPAVNILKRLGVPSAGDLAYWVQSPFDLRTIETMFLAVPEFANNG